jgi:hypothetical protein
MQHDFQAEKDPPETHSHCSILQLLQLPNHASNIDARPHYFEGARRDECSDEPVLVLHQLQPHERQQDTQGIQRVHEEEE